jgi:hypothetical protein
MKACDGERVENTGHASDSAYNMAIVHCIGAIESLATKEAAAVEVPKDQDGERWRFMMRAADDFNGPETELMNEFTQWSEQVYGDGTQDKRPQSVILTEVVDKAREKFAQQIAQGDTGGDE